MEKKDYEITFTQLDEFERDLKKLEKKYKTIREDLETLKKTLKVWPAGRSGFSVRVNNLGIETCVVKVKKMACRYLKGQGSNTGLRLIYSYLEEERAICLVEIYYKGDQENENRERILKHFK